MLLNLVADYVGMCKMLGRGSNGGSLGCVWCEVRGFKHAGRMCFPCGGEPTDGAPARTKQSTLADGDVAVGLLSARVAQWCKDHVSATGVRARCSFDRLEYFDSTVDALLDMMHAVSVTVGGHIMKVLRGKVWSKSGSARLAKKPQDPRVQYGWGPTLDQAYPKGVKTLEEKAKCVNNRVASVRRWESACAEVESANADARPLTLPKRVQARIDRMFHAFQGPGHLSPGSDRDVFEQRRNMKSIDWSEHVRTMSLIRFY
jgi:hypothetical protein